MRTEPTGPSGPRLVGAALVGLILTGCAFHAPTSAWHRPGASSTLSERDRAALKTDQDACVEERNNSGVRMFWGAAWYEVTQRSLYKDCMEARGWTKEEP